MKPLGRTIALATSLALAAPCLAAPAFAQPNAGQKTEAASRFKKGLDLFKDGDFQAALIEFRRAYELAPNYQVLYNIGQVSFQLQDYPGALAALQKYLLEGGRNIPNARRAEVEKDIEKLKSRVANLDIVVNVPDADVFVDDVNVGKSPLNKSVLVSAGRHRVAVSRAGYTSGAKLVEIASQESQKVNFELTETQSSQPQPIPPVQPEPTKPGGAQPTPQPTPGGGTEPQGPNNYTPAIIGWCATGGLTIGAVVTGIVALGASNDLKDLRSQPGQTRQTLDDAAGKTTTFALLTDILGGAAIVGAGVSIYLTATASPAPVAAAPAATGGVRDVRLGVVPGGLRLSGRF
jgi:PEGA domain/Tetratricopeptide repeat